LSSLLAFSLHGAGVVAVWVFFFQIILTIFVKACLSFLFFSLYVLRTSTQLGSITTMHTKLGADVFNQDQWML